MSAAAAEEEHFDVLDAAGARTGERRARSEVHRLGLFHRAVHVWLLAPASGELLLQLRAASKDSWPSRWDVSSAGHVSAGEESLPSARRELREELGLALPAARLRPLFTHLEMLDSEQRGKPFLNHEFNDVYLVELSPEERARLGADNAVLRDDADGGGDGEDAGPEGGVNARWQLQRSEVAAVRWQHWREVRTMYETHHADIVPLSDFESYARLFDECERVCAAHAARSAAAAASAAAGP
jgi:isopentenyldiphosphate isomerase